MSKTPSTATLVGKVIGALIHSGITFWAATATSGLIHAVLVGQLILSAVVWIAYGTIALAKAEASKRPTYGDVHVNIEADSSRFADAMARTAAAARRLDGLDGTRR